MKKTVIKSIGVIGSAVLPSAAVIACGADDISPDQTAVNLNIENIKKLERFAKWDPAVLASTVTGSNLSDKITQPPQPTEGVSITPTIIGHDDPKGTLDVKYTVTKGEATETVTITYTGFKSVTQQDVELNIQAIKLLDTEANLEGSTVLPSTVTAEDLYNKIVVKPTPTLGVTVRPTIVKADDSKGTLDVKYTATKGDVTEYVTLKYTGFITADRKIIDDNVAIVTALPVNANSTGKVSLPSIITKDNLYTYLEADKPKPTGGATIEIKTLTSDDINGTLVVNYTIKKGTLEETVSKEYLEFNFNWVESSVLVKNIATPEPDEPARVTSFAPGWVQETSSGHYLIAQSNGIHEIETLGTQIIGDYNKGKEFTSTPEGSFDQGWSVKLKESLYLIAAGPSIYFADVGVGSGTIDGVIEAKTEGVVYTYTNNIVNINENHYLAISKEQGLDQIEVTSETSHELTILHLTKEDPGEGKPFLPDASLGWIEKINDAHYLIGTNANGVFEVEVNIADGTVTKTKKVSDSLELPNNHANGFSQKIDDSHYLIGGSNDDTGTDNWMYQVTVDPVTGSVTSTSLVEKGIIPSVLYGFSTSIIDQTHYLIATQNSGLYQVEVDVTLPGNWITRAKKVSSTPISTYTQFKDGWIKNISLNTYWIGTEAGIYNIVLKNLK